MRAVTGTVTSSKPVSISKAARLISRFAAVDTGSRRDVAAYLRRATKAFEDLVQFHRELRSSRNQVEVQTKQQVEDKDDGVEKDVGNARIEANRDHVDGHSKKKKEKESAEEERRELGGNNEVIKVEGEEEERSEERKKRKEKKKKKRERQVVENGEGFQEEQRDRYGKKRKHLSVEEGNGGGDEGSEIRKKKKKRRKTETEK